MALALGKGPPQHIIVAEAKDVDRLTMDQLQQVVLYCNVLNRKPGYESDRYIKPVMIIARRTAVSEEVRSEAEDEENAGDYGRYWDYPIRIVRSRSM